MEFCSEKSFHQIKYEMLQVYRSAGRMKHILGEIDLLVASRHGNAPLHPQGKYEENDVR